MVSPSFFNHERMVPSIMLSPICGITISIVAILLFFRVLNGCLNTLYLRITNLSDKIFNAFHSNKFSINLMRRPRSSVYSNPSRWKAGVFWLLFLPGNHRPTKQYLQVYPQYLHLGPLFHW